MNLDGRTALVIGGTSGIGKATAERLAADGARTWVASRNATGEGAIAGDATDERFVEQLLDLRPDVVVVSLGINPRTAPLDEHDWDSFSAAWHTDVKATFLLGKAALLRPLRDATVVVVSSGAAIAGSPLSGGYAGAKRSQWLTTLYLRQEAQKRGLGTRFHVIVPKQLVVGTDIGEHAANAYSRFTGLDRDQYFARWPKPLTADGVAAGILEILSPDRAGTGTFAVDGSGLSALD
jgi:NAD(P)-dependent dehydrogenase (short-subunit alcohol dehydrogenase family)